DLALAPVPVALQDLDRGRLPRAVRAHKREDLARAHLEIDDAHCLEVAIRLAQALDADHRLRHRADVMDGLLDRGYCPTLRAWRSSGWRATAQRGAARVLRRL